MIGMTIQLQEANLHPVDPVDTGLNDEVMRFLSSAPSPEAIVAFRPSTPAQAKITTSPLLIHQLKYLRILPVQQVEQEQSQITLAQLRWQSSESTL